MQYALRVTGPDVSSPEHLMSIGRNAEQFGFASVWSSEAGHDPFVSLPLVIAATKTVRVGTGIAVAYARSPYSTAQVAFDLQRLSQGRFRLGLGTQVKAHIERRYGVAWPGGVSALREYVLCCRAVWDSFQHGTRPAFEGAHFRFTLSNPEFSPSPLPADQANIPVWIAAVNTLSARLAGELAEGLSVHSFHTEAYLRKVLLPAAQEGRATAGRVEPLQATCPVFAGIAHDDRQAQVICDQLRKHIAFYASTPAYMPVLESAGAEALHEPLRQMVRAGKWAEMPAVIDDATLEKFAIVDTPQRLGERLAAKYAGILSEISLYRDGGQFASEQDWGDFLLGLRNPRG